MRIVAGSPACGSAFGLIYCVKDTKVRHTSLTYGIVRKRSDLIRHIGILVENSLPSRSFQRVNFKKKEHIHGSFSSISLPVHQHNTLKIKMNKPIHSQLTYHTVPK